MRGAAVWVLVAALAGCSSPTGSPTDPAPSTATAPDEGAVRDGLARAFAGSDPTLRQQRDSACFARELVDRADPEQLREGGLVAEDGTAVRRLPPLPEDLAELAADAQLACVDLVEASTRALTSVRKGDLDATAYADCLVEAVPPDAQREALVATLAGRYDDDAVTRLADAQVSCAGAQD